MEASEYEWIRHTLICEALPGLLPLLGEAVPVLPMLRRASRPSGRLAFCLLPAAMVKAEGSSRHISLVWRGLGMVVMTSAMDREAV